MSSNQNSGLLNQLPEESKRALSFFEARGFRLYFDAGIKKYVRAYIEHGIQKIDVLTGAKESLITHYVNDFLPSWGKNDWTMKFLEDLEVGEKFAETDIIKFIFLDVCNIQASSTEKLDALKIANTESLRPAESKLDIGNKTLNDNRIFYTDEQIGDSIHNTGKLEHHHLKYIHSIALDNSSDHLATEELCKVVEDLDARLEKKSLDGLFRISSSVRSLLTQKLYKELGYPAFDLSCHNFGMAFDIALSHKNYPVNSYPNAWIYYIDRLNHDQNILLTKNTSATGTLFFAQLFKIYVGTYNNEQFTFLTPRIKAVNNLAVGGISLSVNELVKHDILNSNEPICRVFSELQSTKEIEVIDETPFFSVINQLYIDKSNNKIKSKSLVPVFHCQLSIGN